MTDVPRQSERQCVRTVPHFIASRLPCGTDRLYASFQTIACFLRKGSAMSPRLFALGAAALAAPLLLAAAAPVTGTWTTEARDAQVEIAPCGKSLCGRLVKFLKAPPGGVDQRDVNNPDPKLRGRRLLGLPLLTGFMADGDAYKGRIYDPKSGKSYRSVLIAKGNTLVVKGCIGPFCQSQKWARAR